MRVELELRLSEEQKILAEENFRLVFSFVNRFKAEGGDQDEYFSRIQKAYMRAIMTFDSTKAKLSTYAFKGMHFARREFLSRHTGRKRRREVSSIFNDDGFLHEPVSPDEHDERDGKLDLLDKRKVLLSFFRHLQPTQRKVLKLAINGLSHNEIGQQLGMRVPNVSYSFCSAIRKLRYEMMTRRGMRVEDWI